MYSEYVYVLKSGPYFKIGRTTDFGKRISQLKIQLPFEVELFKVINTDDCAKLEKYLHKIYAAERVNGEWFELSNRSIADLFLIPASISCIGRITEQQMLWDDVLDAVTEKLERRSRERELEQLIKGEAEFVSNEIPEHWGGAPFADYLAYECPYDPDPIDMEWTVFEETGE